MVLAGLWKVDKMLGVKWHIMKGISIEHEEFEKATCCKILVFAFSSVILGLTVLIEITFFSFCSFCCSSFLTFVSSLVLEVLVAMFLLSNLFLLHGYSQEF